jgi:hypothetical protein
MINQKVIITKHLYQYYNIGVTFCPYYQFDLPVLKLFIFGV